LRWPANRGTQRVLEFLTRSVQGRGFKQLRQVCQLPITHQVSHGDHVGTAVVDHIRRAASNKAWLELLGDLLDALDLYLRARVELLLQLRSILDVVIAKTASEEDTVNFCCLQAKGIQCFSRNLEREIRFHSRDCCSRGGSSSGSCRLAGGKNRSSASQSG
jgi:hypothetical protein